MRNLNFTLRYYTDKYGKINKKRKLVMIGLIIAIIAFNLIAFIVNKRLTANQIVHIWIFTTAFQLTFDFM